MKFLLEFVTCYGSRSSEVRPQAEETSLLVAQEPPRRGGRKQGRGKGGSRDWRPSLSSISEDALAAQRINNVERPASGWRRTLKRKVASVPQRDRISSSDRDDCRRAPVPAIIPPFSATPFMF